MRKKVFGRKLGRNRNSRTALFRSLVWALLENGQIVTTRARAKAIVPMIDGLITLAKKDSESSRRLVLARLGNNTRATQSLLALIPKVGARTSGFTRIVALPRRLGDAAEMVKLEFVDKNENLPTNTKTS